MQEYLNYLVANGGQIGAAIQKTAYPIYHMGLAIAEGNALSMLIFVLCCAVPFGLVYLILSSNFIRIATSSGGAAKVKYREKALRVSGVRSALTKKELRHFLSNPMYIMNAALGSVISVLLAGFAVFQLSKLTDAVSKIGLNVPIAALAAFMLAMCAGMNFISAPSVSLEGKNLWISRSIPAASRDVLESKAMAHFIAGLPSILISGAVFDILLHPDPLAAVCMFLLPLSVNALTAYIGVVVNLKFPRMDWISDVQAVKQSMSTMICMFGSMAIVIAPVLLYAFLLTGILGSDLFVLICAALFTAVAALLRAYLHRGGSAVFESL
jgi:ABC-2 type transport system permease protein